MSISAINSASSALQAYPQGMQSVAYNVTNIERETHLHTEFVDGGNYQVQAHTELVPTQTDYARETVNSIIYQRAFEANVVTVHTADDMLGTLVNLKV